MEGWRGARKQTRAKKGENKQGRKRGKILFFNNKVAGLGLELY